MDATWIAFAFLCRWGGVYYTALLPARRAERNSGPLTYLVVGAAAMPWLLLTKAKREGPGRTKNSLLPFPLYLKLSVYDA